MDLSCHGAVDWNEVGPVTVYAITGNLGSGKTLVGAGRAFSYMKRGRPVASNIDLYPDKVLPAASRATVLRLPDRPRAVDFEALPSAADPRREDLFGCLLLDEPGVWMNAREWKDKDRLRIIDWLLHARKLGWDVLLCVQDLRFLDAQLRSALVEYEVYCQRLDRMFVPGIGRLLKALTGLELRLPRLHVGTVWYARMVVERWWYRGTDVQEGYDTGQLARSGIELVGDAMLDMRASYSLLSAWHIRGRYLPEIDWALFRRTFLARSFAAMFSAQVRANFVPVKRVVSARSARGRGPSSEVKRSARDAFLFVGAGASVVEAGLPEK